MKKVGVTGAAGFIGSHLCERLLQEGCEVVGVDDLSYGSMANLSGCLAHPGFRFEVLDCTRRRKLRVAFDGCDAIAHLAAKKIPRYGGTVSTLEINVNGVRSACAVALSLGRVPADFGAPHFAGGAAAGAGGARVGQDRAAGVLCGAGRRAAG